MKRICLRKGRTAEETAKYEQILRQEKEKTKKANKENLLYGQNCNWMISDTIEGL